MAIEFAVVRWGPRHIAILGHASAHGLLGLVSFTNFAKEMI